ncbi:MAG: hypothetical protein WAU07_05005, partial [Microgenomates group bacterium]
LVPINQINIDIEGREKSIPWNFEGQVLGAHFFSEESAIIVTQKQGGEIELIQLERNLSLKNQNSTVWQPSFEVVYSSEYAVDFMTHNQHCEVSITNDLLIISNDGSRLFSFALHNSAIQPWTPIQLEGPFLETEIGTAVGIKGNRQWLRR